MFTRFDSQDQGRIRSLVENFDNAQSESLRRMQMLDENISQCERQLRLVKDVAAEEWVSIKFRFKLIREILGQSYIIQQAANNSLYTF